MPRNRKDLTLKGATGMPLNFRERQSVIKELANQYKGVTKQDKGLLIDQLQTLTGFNRSYAARELSPYNCVN